MLDLKQRGLLDDTLVIWGGEFGRTPMGQTNKPTGRDHHVDCFTLWLAGGGIRPGLTYGATDEFGFSVAENPVPRPRPAGGRSCISWALITNGLLSAFRVEISA